MMVAIDLSIKSVRMHFSKGQRDGHSKTTLLKCCLHHQTSPFFASKPLMQNNNKDQPHKQVSITSSSSSSSSSELLSSSDDDLEVQLQNLTRKDWLFMKDFFIHKPIGAAPRRL
jgi:ribosomal protein S15P/S13E